MRPPLVSHLILAAGCGGGEKKAEAPKAPEKIVLKFGHLADEKNTWHLGALKFKEIVEKNSNGRIEVKVYPNEQLGNEKALVTSIQNGTADMGIFGETLTTFGANKTILMATPYLLKDAASAAQSRRRRNRQGIEAQVIEKAKVRPIAYFERGPPRSDLQPSDQDP